MAELSMEKRQEVEAVTTAYFLEDNIQKLKRESKRLQNSRPEEPAPPQEPKLRRTKAAPIPYPQIDVQVNVGDRTRGYFKSYNKKFIILMVAAFLIFGVLHWEALALLSLLATVLYIFMKRVIWLFFGKDTAKRQKEEEIRNSPAYQARCREIDEENRRRQQQLDNELQAQYVQDCEQHKYALEQHRQEVRHYQEQVLPQWEAEVAVLQKALDDTQVALQELYDRRIIPAQYRNIPSLFYLATFVGTSNYDLKYAIERYDDYVLQYQQRQQISLQQAQLAVMREISQNQAYTNWLSEQTMGILEQGNATLRSINSWQKADMALRAYWRFKDRRKAK